ncbi:MAG TPA: envelope stress response membrane protein PspB [Allosphingosinicella sp.]|nr:envelope stress response membrane protein PspB [Allosphingosinicella sp.]
MEDVLIPVLICGMLFIGLPWLVFHYVTQWKKNGALTREDENLMDELHDLARRLDERMCSIERIMTAENPNWRSIACDPATLGLTQDRPQERPASGGTVSNQPSRSLGR